MRLDLPLTADPQECGLRLSPTDLSQFIRLEQCERYLRLRLFERAFGRRFMTEYGVRPQSIPPLLTRSGRTFEELVEACVRAHFAVIDLRQETEGGKDRPPDNVRLLEAVRTLPS